MLTYGSLFSGYSGLDMGVQSVLGGRTVWHCEYDAAPSKILAHHWPDVPNLGDITAVDWTTVEPIDVLTGGFPCQDVSAAGGRAGLMEGTRSGLFHEMLRATDALRPRLVAIENVRGLASAQGEPDTDDIEALTARIDADTRAIAVVKSKHRKAIQQEKATYAQRHTTDLVRLMGRRDRALASRRRARAGLVRAFGTVVGRLANIGYDTWWTGFRAADIGAAHGRFRYFIFATPADAEGHTGWLGDRDRSAAVDPDRIGSQGWDTAGLTRQAGSEAGHSSADLTLLPTPEAKNSHAGPDFARTGRERSGGHDLVTAVSLLPTPRATDGTKGGPNQRGSSGDLMLPSAVQLLPTPAVNDMREGKTVPQWDEWTGRMKSKHGNGNGHGKSLSIEALRLLPTPSVADALGGHLTRGGDRSGELLLPGVAKAIDRGRWGDYAPAIDRWEHVLGRPAPDPTEPGAKGGRRLSPRFVEFLMGTPAGHVTDPDIGLTCNQQLKALGNGVVPQQAAAATRMWLAHHRQGAAA